MGKRKAPVAVFAIVVLAGTPLAAQQAAPEPTGPRTTLPMFEYACHEGNYGMLNLLRGTRAEDAEAEAAAKGGDVGRLEVFAALARMELSTPGNPYGAFSRHTRTTPSARHRALGWHAGILPASG